MSAPNADAVRSVRVPDGDPPAPEVIAARIDLGTAEYHETCCYWALYQADESLFDSAPDCDCGGPEMAKVYASLASLSSLDRQMLGIPPAPIEGGEA